MNALLILSLITGISMAHGPRVRFEPPVLTVQRDSTGFVQAMIKVYSTHGDTVRLTGVRGSCACASASVQRPLTHDTTAGKFYLSINAKHFTDSVNYVDFSIDLDGVPNASQFRTVVRLPQEKK